jgi:DNA-binding NtrC family response regulator
LKNHNSVIVVDDEILVLNIISKGFARLGFRCVTASSGEAALDALRSDSFDLMITDMVMNGIDGIELTREAKSLYPEMPVIIMTGFGGTGTYDDAVSAGASGIINKPFGLKELVRKVKCLVENEGRLPEDQAEH